MPAYTLQTLQRALSRGSLPGAVAALRGALAQETVADRAQEELAFFIRDTSEFQDAMAPFVRVVLGSEGAYRPSAWLKGFREELESLRTTTTAPSDPGADEILLAAEDHIDRREFEEAARLFEQALARLHETGRLWRFENGEFFHDYGFALGELGRRREAGEAFRCALRCYPDYRDVLLRLANQYRQTHRSEAARLFHRVSPLHGVGFSPNRKAIAVQTPYVMSETVEGFGLVLYKGRYVAIPGGNSSAVQEIALQCSQLLGERTDVVEFAVQRDPIQVLECRATESVAEQSSVRRLFGRLRPAPDSFRVYAAADWHALLKAFKIPQDQTPACSLDDLQRALSRGSLPDSVAAVRSALGQEAIVDRAQVELAYFSRGISELRDAMAPFIREVLGNRAAYRPTAWLDGFRDELFGLRDPATAMSVPGTDQTLLAAEDHFDKREFADAARLFEQAFARLIESGRLWRFENGAFFRDYGVALGELGRQREAEEAFRCALRCYPDYRDVMLRLAFLVRESHPSEVARLFHKVSKIHGMGFSPSRQAISAQTVYVMLETVEDYALVLFNGRYVAIPAGNASAVQEIARECCRLLGERTGVAEFTFERDPIRVTECGTAERGDDQSSLRHLLGRRRPAPDSARVYAAADWHAILERLSNEKSGRLRLVPSFLAGSSERFGYRVFAVSDHFVAVPAQSGDLPLAVLAACAARGRDRIHTSAMSWIWARHHAGERAFLPAARSLAAAVGAVGKEFRGRTEERTVLLSHSLGDLVSLARLQESGGGA